VSSISYRTFSYFGEVCTPLLIFAQSPRTINVLDSIEGLTYDRYDGRISDKEREGILHNFKKKDV
jgi:hypothetical protein